jgi:phage-related holin
MDGSGKVDMFHYMQRWLENDNTKVIYFLVLILIANMIDFLLGWINAKFNTMLLFHPVKPFTELLEK